MITNIKKLAKVKNEDKGQSDTLYFQLVEVTYNVFGRVFTETFDTRITNKGQFIIDGDGFIKHDLELPA